MFYWPLGGAGRALVICLKIEADDPPKTEIGVEGFRFT